MQMYFIAHEKFLAYAESNPGPLEQIFTKRAFFLWASRPRLTSLILGYKKQIQQKSQILCFQEKNHVSFIELIIISENSCFNPVLPENHEISITTFWNLNFKIIVVTLKIKI